MASPTLYTSNLNLAKPGLGTIRWDTLINNDMDILDKFVLSASGTTGENIDAGAVVSLSSGLIYHADIDHASNADLRKALGLNPGAAVSYGDLCVAVGRGVVQGADPAWSWTTGSPLYLDSVAGKMTHTPKFYSGDGRVQFLGWAIGSDKVFFDPLPPILPTVQRSEGVEFKDGTSNPSASFSSPQWDATEKKVVRTISFDLANQDIDLVFEFSLPPSFIGSFPNNSFSVFSLGVKFSSTTPVASIAEILDTSGTSISSSATASGTSFSDLVIPGSDLSSGSWATMRRISVRVRLSNGTDASATATVESSAELRLTEAPF